MIYERRAHQLDVIYEREDYSERMIYYIYI